MSIRKGEKAFRAVLHEAVQLRMPSAPIKTVSIEKDKCEISMDVQGIIVTGHNFRKFIPYTNVHDVDLYLADVDNAEAPCKAV